MRLPILCLLIGSVAGQTPPVRDLDRLGQELDAAIRSDDLIKAADLAGKLDDAAQRQYRASLNSDANQRVNEVLSWLPADTETLLVFQDLTVLHANDSPQYFFGKPAQFYASDRLMALNGGQIYSRLDSKAIRLMVAGTRNLQSRTFGQVPAGMPDADVAYFYYFSEPLAEDALGVPEESIYGHAVWRGTAKIATGAPWTPGPSERATREDENWLTLARPDLLVLSSRRDTLIEFLKKITGHPQIPIVRALPESLPEWQDVDRQAACWGLRHYSVPGTRLDSSNPKMHKADEAPSDPLAVGVTMRFNVDSGNLEIRYRSGASNPPKDIVSSQTEREFKTLQIADGVWQLKSSTRDRGDYPFHFAMSLLGFGGYR